ncbi:MAG TPA: secretin N-terminal domain-containing protein [Methylomirabilota bacterium]|nr:secretin N-terminal domain-containing protein [Methylomirabilota bacterium]
MKLRTATLCCLAALLASASAQSADPAAPATEPNSPARTEPVPRDTSTRPAANSESEPELRLNFRGVPLEMVLDHLSDAAGFIIVLETKIEGEVDVWSNQPLSRDEAVDLLNTILNRKGYTAIRNGRILTIVDREDAKQRDLPVKTGNDPEAIPRSDEMITQVIPVRYANALQLTKDLQPLLPSYSTLTANESGNALVLTDTQSNIRRMVEIVRALDTSISSISTIRVFPLQYADSKQLAEAVKQLFQPPQQSENDQRARIMNRFRRGPGGDDDGGTAGTGDDLARQAASRVVAVADERYNALVVSAPDEFVPAIEQLVTELDVQIEDITELRVFPLANADPVEMAAVLTGLFQDNTQTENNRTPVRFGRGGNNQRGGNNNAETPSERMKQQNRVVAIADPRTQSVIVSASGQLMEQIGQMIEQLDSNSARKQKVFVYSLENADVQSVQETLRTLFESQNNINTRRNNQNNQNNNALNNRATQNQNQQGNTGIGTTSTRGGGQNFR